MLTRRTTLTHIIIYDHHILQYKINTFKEKKEIDIGRIYYISIQFILFLINI